MSRGNDTVEVERLIVGGGLAGCITAWILASRGIDGVLLEKGSTTAGMNGSFVDAGGNTFDYGRHVLNYGRHDFSTRFFERTLKGPSRKLALKRGILLRGTVIPYAADVARWPAELRDNIRIDPEAPQVRLGSDREAFERAYGKWFADLVFDEVLSAFPTLRWRREHGEPPEMLLDWVFPWFFPLSDREAEPSESSERGVFSAESRRYHFDTRHGRGEEVLYPTGGKGFGQWLDDVVEESASHVEINTGVGDIRFEIDAQGCRVLAVEAGGRVYVPQHVYWCAPIAIFCRTFDWALPRGEPQSLMIGSLAFEQPLDTDLHEILCGDPRFEIRRISFPGLIAGSDRPSTVQLEHLILTKQIAKMSDAEWIGHWEQRLREAGLVSEGNRLLHADLKKLPAGVATPADLQAFSEECQQRLRASEGNVTIPGLTCTPDNLSRRLPIIFADVYESLGLPSDADSVRIA